LLDGDDNRSNAGFNRLHIGDNEFGKQVPGVPRQTPQPAQTAHHLELRLAVKKVPNHL
jgi:hypothetical protein